MKSEQSESLYKLKIEYEKLRHQNIMWEIEAIKEAKIRHFHRE